MKPNVLLVHAAHDRAEEYDNIVWGDPRNGVYGRASKALWCLMANPDIILYIGCGALAPGSPVISELVFEQMVARGSEVDGLGGLLPEDIRAMIEDRVYLDRVSTTTVEEIRAAAKFCADLEAASLTLLSSPTHLPRCLRDAFAEQERPGSLLAGVEVGAVKSDTNFACSVAADVTIFEPPHRADRHRVPIHKAVKTLFGRLGTQAEAEELKRLLDAIGNDSLYDAMLKSVGAR